MPQQLLEKRVVRGEWLCIWTRSVMARQRAERVCMCLDVEWGLISDKTLADTC